LRIYSHEIEFYVYNFNIFHITSKSDLVLSKEVIFIPILKKKDISKTGFNKTGSIMSITIA